MHLYESELVERLTGISAMDGIRKEGWINVIAGDRDEKKPWYAMAWTPTHPRFSLCLCVSASASASASASVSVCDKRRLCRSLSHLETNSNLDFGAHFICNSSPLPSYSTISHSL